VVPQDNLYQTEMGQWALAGRLGRNVFDSYFVSVSLWITARHARLGSTAGRNYTLLHLTAMIKF
jgi:hypothetical protein